MVDELPDCLKTIYFYFEKIVTRYNLSPYLTFRQYVVNVILLATDEYPKDICPISTVYSSPYFKTHCIIYEKRRVVIIAIFLKPYLGISGGTKPEEVPVEKIRIMIRLLDILYSIYI